MGGLECIITGVIDEYGGYLRRTKYNKYTREIFTAVLVGTSFSVALLNVTPVSIEKSFPLRIKVNQVGRYRNRLKIENQNGKIKQNLFVIFNIT